MIDWQYLILTMINHQYLIVAVMLCPMLVAFLLGRYLRDKREKEK
jgi:hypothetical protein